MQANEPTWRDVEMTGYFYGVNSGDAEFVPYCRGARHSNDVNKCHGVAYKAATDYMNGQVRVRKEQWHSSGYVSQAWREGFGGSTRNKWVGMKFMCYNVGNAPNINVKLEIWIDKNNDNNWTKVYDYTDTGNWGDGNHCSGVTNQRLTWSAPLATFRWDVSGLRFKKLSVREINPTGTTPPPGPPSPPGSPPPPPPSPGVPAPPPPGTDLSTRLIYPSSGITAIGHNGNIPANINDGNDDTLWAYVTLPSWIMIDLAALRKLSYIRIRWGRYLQGEATIGFNVETSENNVNFKTMFTGAHVVVPSTGVYQQVDMQDHNARFIRINITSNSFSSANATGINSLDAWGDLTPIGAEPPPPSPEPIPIDTNYVYQSSIHRYHVNYTSASTIDACALPIVEPGSGPDEIEGPDIFPPPPLPPSPTPPPPPPEVNPPMVVNTTPPHTAGDIPINQTITIEMSEAIDIATVTSTTVTISPSVACNRTLTGLSSNIINLDPVASLANSTTYSISVKGGASGVKDLAGNALPTDHNFTFTTIALADTTAPTIVSKTPDSGATGVATTANIIVTFSEPMLPSRVTSSEIDLWKTDDTTDIPIIVTLNGAKTIATINPVATLGGGTQYTCRVRGGAAPSVADLVGNAMADPDVQWNFTTVAPAYVVIYDKSGDGDSWADLDHDPNKSIGLRLDEDSDEMHGRRPRKGEILLRREGSPGGTTSLKIMRDVGSDEPLQEIAVIGTMNSNDISTAANGVIYSFANPGLNHPMEVDDCIVIETSAGTGSAHIQVRRSDDDVWDGGILIRGTDDDVNTDTGRDSPMKVFE
jgi:hypothetical protein